MPANEAPFEFGREPPHRQPQRESNHYKENQNRTHAAGQLSRIPKLCAVEAQVAQ